MVAEARGGGDGAGPALTILPWWNVQPRHAGPPHAVARDLDVHDVNYLTSRRRLPSSAGEPQQHTGIVAAASGFTFVHRGEPYLELLGTAHDLDLGDAEAGDEPRRFAALDEPAAPAVPLPSEPPGWEAQHFVLTLRGRDALNPMTELWMRFRSTYGAPGQRLLEVLADGATLEAVATALDTPLEELRPWLQRLEAEGLVRVGGGKGPAGRL